MDAVKIEDVKRGDFIRRTMVTRKTYRKGGYDRTEKRYANMDCDDISRSIYLKKGTIVYTGFTY